MNARSITSACAVALLTIAATAGAQTPALAGAWTRVSLKDSAGKQLQPPSPTAFVVFSANGFFSQNSIPSGRPKVAKPLVNLTKEELVARFNHLDAWYGTYTVAGNKLTRKRLGDADPGGEGTEVVQTFRIAGDTLIFTKATASASDKTEARFVRAK